MIPLLTLRTASAPAKSAILSGEGDASQYQYRNYNLCLRVHSRISAGICLFNTKPFIQPFRQFPI